jgi:hypothetical protein
MIISTDAEIEDLSITEMYSAALVWFEQGSIISAPRMPMKI